MDKNTQNIESFLVIYLFCVKIYVTGDKMTLEKQIYLLNLFKKLINKYKDTALNIYLQNICDFINALEQSTLYSYEDFMLKIYTIINNYNINNEVSNYNLQMDLNEKSLYNLEDINYLYYIIDKIKLSIIDNNNLDDFETNDYFIKKYIKNNRTILNRYNKNTTNIIYDRELRGSVSIPLDEKNIILTNTKDVTILFHEFLHGIYPDIKTKYREVPSILGEIALQKEYNINSSINRLYHFNLDKPFNEFYLPYLLGTILSKTIINKHGSSFKTIYEIMNLIYNNKETCIKDILNICNINEQDIINSFK